MTLTCTVVLLGREGCGKSSLVARFVQGTYTEQYDPHVVDVYKKEGNVGGAAVVFNVIDVCGSEDFSSIRNMECSKADARILCCDVSPESVAHAEELHETLNDPTIPYSVGFESFVALFFSGSDALLFDFLLFLIFKLPAPRSLF